MNDPNVLTIDWKGPFRLKDFFVDDLVKSEFNQPGVYLWVEDLPDGTDRLSYVGKAAGSPSLTKRQQQHYTNMISGLYTIPCEYRDSHEVWIPQWDRPEVADVILDPGKYKKLVEEGFRYAAACRIYLYPTASNVATLERNLLFVLKPTGTKQGTITEPSQRLTIEHRNPHWLSASISERVKTLVGEKPIFV